MCVDPGHSGAGNIGGDHRTSYRHGLNLDYAEGLGFLNRGQAEDIAGTVVGGPLLVGDILDQRHPGAQAEFAYKTVEMVAQRARTTDEHNIVVGELCGGADKVLIAFVRHETSEAEHDLTPRIFGAEARGTGMVDGDRLDADGQHGGLGPDALEMR